MLATGAKLFTDIPLTVVGMLLFIAAFVAIAWRTYFSLSKEFHQQLAHMPLTEDESERR